MSSALPSQSLAAYLEATEHWPRVQWPARLEGLEGLVLAGVPEGALPDGTQALACLFPAHPTDDDLLLSPVEWAQWRQAASRLSVAATLWENWTTFDAWRAHSAWSRAGQHAGLFKVLLDRHGALPASFWAPPEPSRAWPADPRWEAILAIPFDDQERALGALLATGHVPRSQPGRAGPFQGLAGLDAPGALEAGLACGLDPSERDGEGRTWLEAAVDMGAFRWVARLVRHDPALADAPSRDGVPFYADVLDCLRSVENECPDAAEAIQALRGRRAAADRAAHLEGHWDLPPPSVRTRL